MRSVVEPLAIAAAGSAGAWVRVEELDTVSIVIHGGATFSLLIQCLATSDPGGVDVNTDAFPLNGTAITSAGIYPLAVGGVPVACTHVRIFTTSVTTAPKALLIGKSTGAA